MTQLSLLLSVLVNPKASNRIISELVVQIVNQSQFSMQFANRKLNVH